MSHLVFLISFMNVSLLTLNCIGDSLWEYGSVTNILALKFQCPGFVSLIHCVTKQLQSHFKPIPLTDQFFYYSRCPSFQRPVLKLHQTYYISLDFGGVFVCFIIYFIYSPGLSEFFGGKFRDAEDYPIMKFSFVSFLLILV